MLLSFISAIALMIWIYLVFFHHRFWFGAESLRENPPLSHWPEVVAVIPARNESETIATVVKGHLQNDYPGKFTVLVVDDQSQDGTGEIVKALMTGAKRDLQVVQGRALPKGWSGKLWAVDTGLEAADHLAPDADYILLTDADIVHAPETLRKLVAKAEEDQLSLVSIMAKLDARGFWGSLLMPAFVFFFQKLYPFPAISNPKSRIAGAAGGCMLVERNALREIGGVKAIAANLIDDCSLALAIKDPDHARRDIWLGFDEGVISLRDNRSLETIWTMVKRTAFTQLRYSSLALVGSVVGMIGTYLVAPFVVLSYPLHHSDLALAFAAFAWGLSMLAYAPTLKRYDQSWLWLLLLPVSAVFYTMMTIASAVSHWTGKGGAWKGRTYS